MTVEFVRLLYFTRFENLTEEILRPAATIDQTAPQRVGQNLSFDELLPEHS